MLNVPPTVVLVLLLPSVLIVTLDMVLFPMPVLTVLMLVVIPVPLLPSVPPVKLVSF